MTDRELKNLLGQIKNDERGGTPDDAWVSRSRDILLMQVRNTTDANAKTSLVASMRHLVSVFLPQEMLMGMAHAVGVFVLVSGTVLAGGLASAQVYQDAVPGMLSYRVKLAVESAQLLLAPNDDYRTRLHGEFADHRLEEVAALAEGSVEGHANLSGVLAAFDAEVRALSEGLDRLSANEPDGVADVAKLLERKMAVYQNMLRKASVTLSPQLRARIAASSDLVDGVSVQSVAVIVEKHMAGNEDIPTAVVVSKVEERLRAVEGKALAQPQQTERSAKAQAAIAEAKELLKGDQYQAALTKIAEVAELTKEEEEEGTVTPETPAVEDASKEEEIPAPAEAPAEKPAEVPAP